MEGAVRGKPYAKISIDNVTLGGIKPHPQSRYYIKNNILLVACLQTGHISLEMIDSCTSHSIGLCLRRIALRYTTRIASIWSDNFSFLRAESLDPLLERDFQVAMKNLYHALSVK